MKEKALERLEPPSSPRPEPGSFGPRDPGETGPTQRPGDSTGPRNSSMAFEKAQVLGIERADFVASLGRKLAAMREDLVALRIDPEALAPRDDLRRKLHTLGVAARLLALDGIADAVAEARRVLVGEPEGAPLTPTDLTDMTGMLDAITAWTWAEGAQETHPLRSPSREARSTSPQDLAKLVMNSEGLAYALGRYRSEEGSVFRPNPTLEELAGRLADEVKLALLGPVSPEQRQQRLDLGDGSQVAAMAWTALARLQHMVTEASGGNIRFEGLETETSDEDLARKGASSGKSPATVRLAGRLVLVADDDPAALWFIADLLRAEGCEVIEATTGSDALALAQRFSPEAFVLGTMLDSGDGQELGDVLRKDIVLRDRPILLLTGSDDVVMRLRTLGAGAASFLPKDTDRESLLRALRQMVRPRHDLEERLRLDDDAGGTLDSMGVPTVLEVVTLWRPNSQLRFRNAKVRYELEIREGALQNVARTDQDGERQEGPGLLPGLLTLSNAQFIVTRPSHAAARAEARASLREDVETALANLRGTVATVSGPRLFRIERLLLDGDQLPLYLANVPPLYRGCVHALAAGASPKELAASGLAGPSIVERVLGDMALHGLILSVHDTQGDELLGPAVAKSLASNADRPLMALPTVCSELPGRDSSLDRASHLPTLGDAVASAVSSEDDGLPLPGLPDRRSSSVAQRPHPQGPPKGAEERSETARRRWLLSWLGLGTFV